MQKHAHFQAGLLLPTAVGHVENHLGELKSPGGLADPGWKDPGKMKPWLPEASKFQPHSLQVCEHSGSP